MKIAFVWQGSSDRETFEHWNDGLRAAMRIVEQKHTVTYREPWHDMNDVDLILYWEAPCTAKGQNAEHYNKIRYAQKPKALLFAGGPIEYDTTPGFDMYFVESKINEDEMEALGLPWKRAFGVNDSVLFPMSFMQKQHRAFFQATFAGWKRHQLFADAMGADGVVAGRLQEHDRSGHDYAKEKGVVVLGNLTMSELNIELNKSNCVVNTSEFWGGGQRTTLEALACNCPVVVMDDSPKNREYVEESGCGLVVLPRPDAIRAAVDEISRWGEDKRSLGRKYIESKWTAKHYADSLLSWINNI